MRALLIPTFALAALLGSCAGTNGEPCDVDADCKSDPADPCSAAACVDGACQLRALDGLSPTQEPGDCRQTVCQSGARESVPDDSDLPPREGPCWSPSCVVGTPTQQIAQDTSPCKRPAGDLGFCQTGECIEYHSCASAADCPDSMYCHWLDGTCGTGKTGVCFEKPEECLGGCPGVCGCDGAWHCNGCSMLLEGIDVAQPETCGPAPGTYSASFEAPGTLRVRKADPWRDLCFTLLLTSSGPSAPGYIDVSVPLGWSVDAVSVTHRADDCATDLPPAAYYNFDQGQGAVTFTLPPGGGSAPCSVDVDLLLSVIYVDFDWAPWNEQLQTTGLTVQGGCF